VLAAKQDTHQPGIARALGLHARDDGSVIISQTALFGNPRSKIFFHRIEQTGECKPPGTTLTGRASPGRLGCALGLIACQYIGRPRQGYDEGKQRAGECWPPSRTLIGRALGERQVKAYPRTQTDRRTVGKANGRRIIGAFRKTLFGTTFRFV